MTWVFKTTYTQTLRFKLQSRKIYIKELITSREILSKHPLTPPRTSYLPLYLAPPTVQLIFVTLAPSVMKPYPDHLNYSAPPPQVVQFGTSGHHPHVSLKLGLNDPHALEEDIIYAVMQALCSQIGATMCAVLVLPHMTPASLIDQY